MKFRKRNTILGNLSRVSIQQLQNIIKGEEKRNLVIGNSVFRKLSQIIQSLFSPFYKARPILL